MFLKYTLILTFARASFQSSSSQNNGLGIISPQQQIGNNSKKNTAPQQHYSSKLSTARSSIHTSALNEDDDQNDASDTDTTTTTTTTTIGSRKKFQLIQVQFIHRHGDRSPITPLKDEEYWYRTLPPPAIIEQISAGMRIRVIKDDKGGATPNSHAAVGVGPFGKLTQLGLFQMVEVGTKLREDILLENFSTDDDDSDEQQQEYIDEHGHVHRLNGRLFTPQNPLHPSKIRVLCTDFSRTIQSVQGLLIGLFPDGIPLETSIDIDTRLGNSFIPDPQPRLTREQVLLERTLSQRPHMKKKEEDMRGLAMRLTLSLRNLLAGDADDVSYGIGEEDDVEDHSSSTQHSKDTTTISTTAPPTTTTTTTTTTAGATIRPLSSSKLADVLTCLKQRNMLPASISEEEYQAIALYSAYRWFENLRDARLAKLAMKPFMNLLMDNLRIGRRQSSGVDDNEDDCEEVGSGSGSGSSSEDEGLLPSLHIFSCHDSSLIGLMCAFRLEQPAVWPEYGSYLKFELFAVENDDDDDDDDDVTRNLTDKKFYVRFSLNGKVLRSSWGVGEKAYVKPAEMICLDHLVTSIEREHGVEV